MPKPKKGSIIDRVSMPRSGDDRRKGDRRTANWPARTDLALGPKTERVDDNSHKEDIFVRRDPRTGKPSYSSQGRTDIPRLRDRRSKPRRKEDQEET